MRSIKFLAPLLTLCFILVVSAASADIEYAVVIPGGSVETTANGGSVAGAHGYTIFDKDVEDLGSIDLSDNHMSVFDVDDLGTQRIRGVKFDHILSEVIWAGADIAAGQTGSAAASYSTNGAVSATQQLNGDAIDPDDHNKVAALSTSMNGEVGVTLNKDTVLGKAHAEAAMVAQAAIEDEGDAIGGDAYQFATVLNSGLGAGNAFTNGEASFNAIGGDNFAFGYANGDINIQGFNDAIGGEFSGTGLISAMTWNTKEDTRYFDQYAKDVTIEYLTLNANRGVSFDGRSTVDGTLNGQEAAESLIINRHHGDREQVVDIESTSKLDGTATALLARDDSSVTLELASWASLYETDRRGYDAFAGVHMDAEAQTERHKIGGTEKAMAEGYIPLATWTATADGNKGSSEHLASVTGSQGPTDDGQPAPFQGFGVGAWILDEFNNPVSAEVEYNQFAGAEWNFLLNTFELDLNGMKATGKTDDAVGAFGGIKGQYSQYIDRNYDNSEDLASEDLTAIEWLEGNNPNPLPGHYFPYTMDPEIDVGATYRNVKLDWVDSNVDL